MRLMVNYTCSSSQAQVTFHSYLVVVVSISQVKCEVNFLGVTVVGLGGMILINNIHLCIGLHSTC